MNCRLKQERSVGIYYYRVDLNFSAVSLTKLKQQITESLNCVNYGLQKTREDQGEKND